MAEREHLDPSQEALQKQKKKGRAVWLGLAVAAAVVVLAAVGVCAAAHGSQRIFSGTEGLGVELGGILLGVIEQLSKTYISTLWADAIVFGVLVVVLVVKPTGLLGKKISEKV